MIKALNPFHQNKIIPNLKSNGNQTKNNKPALNQPSFKGAGTLALLIGLTVVTVGPIVAAAFFVLKERFSKKH